MGSCGNSVSLFGKLSNYFHSGCTILHSYQQWKSSHFSTFLPTLTIFPSKANYNYLSGCDISLWFQLDSLMTLHTFSYVHVLVGHLYILGEISSQVLYPF